MRTELKRVTFFTKKEFDKLGIKKLTRLQYKNFISDWNKLICEEVLENPDGYYLPEKHGIIKIVKKKLKKPIYTTHAVVTGKQKEYNLHSFGYIYWIKHFMYYYRKADKKKLFGSNINTFLNLYRFKAHRLNLKRPLAQIIKKGERDYEAY